MLLKVIKVLRSCITDYVGPNKSYFLNEIEKKTVQVNMITD